MNIIKELAKYYFAMAGIFFAGRLALFYLYFDNFKNSGVNYWLCFFYGIRMDTIIIFMLLLIPLILLTLTPKILADFVQKIFKFYFLVVFIILIYIENATFPFIAEYDVRPNFLFVEYLEYPREVFSMIFADYKFEILITFIIIAGFTYFYLKYVKNSIKTILQGAYYKRALLFIPFAVILFIGIRSSFGHRPANISDAMYSSNRMVNEITKNSLYSIGYAVYVNKKHGSEKLMKQYGKMDINTALNRVKNKLGIKTDTDKNSPLSRIEKTHFKTDNPRNLVIFLQESLGYQFVEVIGGEKGITPNINKLSHEGILFKELYANGTRSIRGIAGSTAGNFSIPGRGVLKRNKSQKDFFTISSLLEPFGYKTTFIYGGESRFDNMKGWFSGNGFDEIIDEPQFKNPTFVGTWGVSDEDLVIRANEEFKNLYSKGQKFATVMFSTSNHTPFDFPDNKIKMIKGIPEKSVKNAVKYADFAIGKLIELAKKEDYYKDTIFVILADHNVRTYGDDVIPVNMFHIPGLIIGGGIKSKIYEGIVTQPDVLATALDLMGIDFNYPVMGKSIFSDDKKDFSLMQFYSSYALRVKNKVAVISPNKKPMTFNYKNRHLIETAEDVELQKDLLAFIVMLDHLYQKRLYK